MATAAADLARFRELNGDRPPTAEELSELSGLDVALCADILKSPQQEVAVEKPQETGTEQPKKRRRTKKPEASAEVAAEESAKGPKTAAKAKASTRQTKPKKVETPVVEEAPPPEKAAATPVAVVPASGAQPVSPPPMTPPVKTALVPTSPQLGQQRLQFKAPQAWSITCRFSIAKPFVSRDWLQEAVKRSEFGPHLCFFFPCFEDVSLSSISFL